MKILSPDLQNTGGVQSKKSSRATDSKKDKTDSSSSVKPSSGGGDKVAISQTGVQMKVFRAALSDIPPTRAERVSAMKSEIESGNYHPPAEAIADAMMQSVQKFS